jgi:uncharacterized membrane protein YhaH (DUF805 family)
MRWMFLPFVRMGDYSGRSRRREFWLFQLLKVLTGILLAIGLSFAGALTSAPLFSDRTVANMLGNFTLLVTLLLYILFFLPAEIALTVRRWHDIGNSGWTIVVVLLFSLIPVIGFVAALVHFAAMCWPGDKGANRYGFPPPDKFPS